MRYQDIKTIGVGILASVLVSGTACELEEFPEEEEPTSINAAGAKWFPGHYLMFPPRRVHKEKTRIEQSTEFVRNTAFEPGVRGVMIYVDWDRLENGKGEYDTPTMEAIGTWLKLLEGSDRALALYMRGRNFGARGDKNKAFVPDYIKRDYCVTTSGPSENSGAMACLWDPGTMDRKIALMAEIGRRYDSHPNFAAITAGESTVSGDGFSHQAWKRELSRYLVETKKAFPNSLLVNELNFLGNGRPALTEMANHMADIGGIGYGWPDTVPCRDPRRSEKCGYKIESYDVSREFQGVLPVSPNVETHDLLPSDLDAVFDMLTSDGDDSLRANYVFWQNTFTSRRYAKVNDGDGYYAGWRRDLLAKFKQEDGRIHTEKPSQWQGEGAPTRPDEPDAGDSPGGDDPGGDGPGGDAGPGGDDPDSGEPDDDGFGIDLCKLSPIFC